ncbi:putative RNA-directed DNA polymerase from transposon X-element [Trichonephila clavipes]|nr:putative RNA-directed DNA polymerase from transposon X-element [Trichonephila clavipes]
MTIRLRGYNCLRRDVECNTSLTGGVCLFTSHLYPSNVVTFHTSLQAVAVRIHIHSLVTVCCIYLPPNNVILQVDLNRLVKQLPAPFISLGDFNGYSPLWGHDGRNSRGEVDDVVLNVTDAIIKTGDAAIPKTLNSHRKLCKSWWNSACHQAKKEQRRAWSIFRRYPTTDNLIAFKRANRQLVEYDVKVRWILGSSTHLRSHRLLRVNIYGENATFLATKNRSEHTPINFRCQQFIPYNSDFYLWELKSALSLDQNTSPGRDGIPYKMIRHLNEDSLLSLLYLFNRIWMEQMYPSIWEEAIVHWHAKLKQQVGLLP